MIFQDPMMTLNPVLRVDTQMIEAVQAHARCREQALPAPCPQTGDGGHSVAAGGACARIRTSCPGMRQRVAMPSRF